MRFAQTTNSTLSLTLSEGTSANTSATGARLLNASDVHDEVPTVRPKGCDPIDVLYKITCHDITDRNKKNIIDRDSTVPFEGFERNQEESNKYDLSIMDDVTEVYGFSERKRLSQHRKHVGTKELEDDNYPFIGGRDFRVTNHSDRYIRIWSSESHRSAASGD